VKSEREHSKDRGSICGPHIIIINLFSNNIKLGIERVQACTRSHFAFALHHPRSMDEMGRRTQHRFCRRWGESSPHAARMRSACGVRWAWRITAGSATHFHSVL